MNPRVQSVRANPDHTLIIVFTNGETREFDVKPYLDKGIFQELQDTGYFGTVRPFLGSIQWPHGQDFCPDTLYEESQPVSIDPSSLDDKTLDQDQDCLGEAHAQSQVYLAPS